MPRFQYRLRTLLLAALVVGCGLGWWFRPYTIEERWPNGNPRSQLRVRRSWNGKVVTNGTQSWWWSNGQLARRGQSNGIALSPRGAASAFNLSLTDEQMYIETGERMRPSGTEFGLMWLHFQPPDDGWELQPDDRFPETPHATDEASTGGSILVDVP